MAIGIIAVLKSSSGVASAFQPVRLIEAGTDARPTGFSFFAGGPQALEELLRKAYVGLPPLPNYFGGQCPPYIYSTNASRPTPYLGSTGVPPVAQARCLFSRRDVGGTVGRASSPSRHRLKTWAAKSLHGLKRGKAHERNDR